MIRAVAIQHREGRIITVVENPGGVMSKGAVALAWAKSQGYSKFPTDCTAHEVNVVSYGTVQRALTPCHELEQLEKDGKSVP